MKAALHPYQEHAVDFIEQHKSSALFLEMGLGKTLSSLTAIEELLNTFGLIENVLVIAPLSVATKTWSDEIEKWDHLQCLSYSKILGPEATRLQALNQKADVYIINRENVVWLVEHYKTKWPFKTVIIDELSSFKDSKSKRFKALKKIRPKIERLIGLTGTPAPNTLIDLWPQLYLLDGGKRLGKTIGSYRSQYFSPGAGSGHVVYEWKLLPNAEQAIFNKIEDICISMKTVDYLDMPKRTDNVIEVVLDQAEEKQYKQLEKELLLPLKDSDVVASNAAVLSNKLLQLANGCIYDEFGEAQFIHDQKLKALERIIEEAQGQPILVFYNFKHDLARIQKQFPEAITLDVKKGHLEAWNNGEIQILLAHPQSAGHGLNLQKGGHIIVWFGLTWSLEYYQQANARLDRQGQTQPVIVHHIITKNTMDEQVLKTLQTKEVGQNALLEAVKARIEEAKR